MTYIYFVKCQVILKDYLKVWCSDIKYISRKKGKITRLGNIGHCDLLYFEVKPWVILTHNQKMWCLYMKYLRYMAKSLDHEIKVTVTFFLSFVFTG